MSQWERVEQLVIEASELSPSERIAFLDANCTDPVLRAEVESLLAHVGDEAGHLTTAIGNIAAGFMASEAPVASGGLIGSYRVIRQIGAGGMGVVLEAVRDDDQYRKQVAIKLVHGGVGTEHMIRRFRMERQILARLEHPYIARLIDGGETPNQQPYLVMEFVDGVEIITYSNKNNLTVEQRIELFQKVCEGVDYAHKNLIVHRDLKPANILVSSDGIPKLLDFGIAKLLEQNPTDSGIPVTRTMAGMLMMTPEYASPEQVMGESITTASDVYALGLILYELLTGIRGQVIRDFKPAEIARVVCQEEPAPPSVAGKKQELAGDLDNIILKAIRKDPARRYGSVSDLSDDLRRYLDHRPVRARADTFVYRAGKFVRRNTFSVIAAATAIVALVAGTAISLYQARLARERFEEGRKFARTLIIDFEDELVKVQGALKARQIFTGAALEYLDNLSKSAGDDADLLAELAHAYGKISRVQFLTASKKSDALQYSMKSIALLRRASRLKPEMESELGHALWQTADQYRDNGQFSEAVQSVREAISISERVYARNPNAMYNLAVSSNGLGRILHDQSKHEEAYEAYKKANDLFRRIVEKNPTNQTREDLHLNEEDLAELMAETGRLEEAAATGKKLIADAERALRDDPKNVRAMRMLAFDYLLTASFYYQTWAGPSLLDAPAAMRYRNAAKPIWDELAADPQNRDAALSNTVWLSESAMVMVNIDQAKAIEFARKAMEGFDGFLKTDPDARPFRLRRARGAARLSYVLQRAGRQNEAKRYALEAVSGLREVASKDEWSDQVSLTVALLQAGSVHADLRDFAGAEPFYRDAIQVSEYMAAHAPKDHEVTEAQSRTYEGYSRLLAATGRKQEARQFLERSLAVWNEFPYRSTWLDRRKALLASGLQTNEAKTN